MTSSEDPRVDELEAKIKRMAGTIRHLADTIDQQDKVLKTQDQLLTALKSAYAPSEHHLIIGRIANCTRVIGVEQGFQGLPIRDGEALDETLRKVQFMDSAWEVPEQLRKAIAGGAPLILRLIADTHPPVMLMLGQRVE